MSMQTEFETSISPTSGKDGLVTFDADTVKYRRRKRALILRNQGVDSTSVDSEDVGPQADEPAPKELGIRPLRFPRSPVRIAPREITLQEWEGRVVQIQGRLVIARLVDITAGETEESEEVELPLDDVTESDQALLRPGAIFRWILGYSYASGRKERFARVIVRRLPVWTAREMSEADREANELHNAIFGASEDWAASAG
ncbi:hypothetical protein ABIA06_005912 [Bradyrhizobium yuanmingense]|uniref:hypothetical protein n=1 Tax=Bradyrhizobium yuanmingense TaxID=108015 RepID=UPI0035192AA9